MTGESRQGSPGGAAATDTLGRRPRGATVLQNGRPKAFRPLSDAARWSAFNEALEAWERGDFFETHELLEPAWMGTADPMERDLHQGLIKLAAAFVHGVRGNSVGIARNLAGARDRLAATSTSEAARTSGLDVPSIVAAIDERMDRLRADPDDASIEPPVLVRHAT